MTIAAAAAVLGERAIRDVPLGPMTTYRVGGPAALFVTAESLDDLALVRRAVAGSDMPTLIVGRGSNLLVSDAGFPGVAVALGEAFATVDLGDTAVRAGGAVALPVLARRTAGAGLTGLEWMVGVPGSVGGAVRMNAGGHGADVAGCLRRAWVFDLGATPEEPPAELEPAVLTLGYRSSVVAANQVVTAAEFAVGAAPKGECEARVSEIVRWRRENQPGGQNAGSVFTNPPGDSAGRLIEAAGLKGLRRGSAEVSAKHANFIQADDGGSADDVLALIRDVQRRVEEAMGVRLVPELRLVGFD